MSELKWVHHRYGGSTADVDEGHYLVQYEQYYGPGKPHRAERFKARLVRRGLPSISLGYHLTAADAIKACEQHNKGDNN